MLLNEQIASALKPFNATPNRPKKPGRRQTRQRAVLHNARWSGFQRCPASVARPREKPSSGNLQAIMESTTVIASGLHEVTEEWMRFAQERVEHNLNHLDRLGNCRNLHDCVALQTQIVRDNLQAFFESAQRTSERSTRIARSAADRMTSPAI